MTSLRTRVRDHIPLEQGLRLRRFELRREPYIRVRDHIPLEQGLRPAAHDAVGSRLGQRPYSIRTRIKTSLLPSSPQGQPRVRDHIPLEQGLRQVCNFLVQMIP